MNYFTPVTNHWSLVPTMDIPVFGGENFCEKIIVCLFSWWFLLSTIFLQSPFFTIIWGIFLSLFPTTVSSRKSKYGIYPVLLPFFSSYSPRFVLCSPASPPRQEAGLENHSEVQVVAVSQVGGFGWLVGGIGIVLIFARDIEGIYGSWKVPRNLQQDRLNGPLNLSI